MKFAWSFWGNDKIKKIFEIIVTNNNPSSAYIFAGPSQIGKSLAAKEFIKALNCQNKEIKPCNQCVACLEINRGEGQDILFLTGEDSIKIENIREIKRKIFLKSSILPFKIVFIENAERMTEEAANALLKILEEPPKRTIFVLTTSSLYNLLPTIVSRCQVFKMQSLTFAEIEKGIFEKTKDKTLSQYLASIAAGKPGRAITLLEDRQLLEKSLEVLNKFLEIKDKDNFEKIQFVEEIFSLKISPHYILDFWLYFIRDILLFKNENLDLISNVNLKEVIAKIKDKYTFSQLNFLVNLLLRIRKLLDKNVKPKLAFEVLLLEV